MKHLTFSVIGNELFCTYDDGEVRLVKKRPVTDDFIFDCALIMDGLPAEVAARRNYIKEKGKNNEQL